MFAKATGNFLIHLSIDKESGLGNEKESLKDLLTLEERDSDV